MQLININLLPKKESIPSRYFYITVGTVGIGIIGTVVTLFLATPLITINTAKQVELQQLQKQEMEVRSSLRNSVSRSIETLVKNIEWAKQDSISFTDILNRIIAQLPAYGNISDLVYSVDGTISMNVQFRTAEDALFFYARLKGQDWLQDVKLSTIAAQYLTKENVGSQVEKRYFVPFVLVVNDKIIHLLHREKKGG